MANRISNQFAITALQEGVTVSGSLRVNGSLSQNWNNNTQKCIPDWKLTPASRPTIYPVIRKGVQYLAAANIIGGTWLYNDVPIGFDEDTHKSTNFLDANNDPIFQVGTAAVTLGGSQVTVPTLTIISNLASATNIDLDTIGYQGSIEVQGKQAAFQCQVDVKMSRRSFPRKTRISKSRLLSTERTDRLFSLGTRNGMTRVRETNWQTRRMPEA